MPSPMYTTQEFSKIIPCKAGPLEVHQEAIIGSKAEGLYETAHNELKVCINDSGDTHSLE